MALDASTKHQRMMTRIQNLLALADDPGATPAEAQVARSQADALMFRYKIDTLTEPEHASLVNPEWREFWICEARNSFSHFYTGIAREVLRHNGILVHTRYEQRIDAMGFSKSWIVLDGVGFGADLQYAEMLIVSAIMAFGKAIEPKYDPKETPGQNALRLRRGGMERHRIATAMFGKADTVNAQKALNRKVTGLIKAEAARLGEPRLAEEVLGRKGSSIATYRESYANGFYWTLNSRITTLAQERAQTGGGTMVLASWKERLEEALYVKYPHLRPRPQEAQLPSSTNGSQAKSQKDCEKCHKAKSGYCREHQWMKPRVSSSTRAWSSAGQRAGSHAARTVDLGGSRGSLTG